MSQEKVHKPRRIRQISVTNLFGVFNHTIPLKMDERITIIHGPNGFGKTMMLKLLAALFGENDNLLLSIPFGEFKVDFEDNTSFWVSKNSFSQGFPSEEHLYKQEITFHTTGQDSFSLQPSSFQMRSSFTSEILRNMIIWYADSDKRNPSISPRVIRESVSPQYEVGLPELYGDLGAATTNKLTKVPEWLIRIRESISVRLIETQRLVSFSTTTKTAASSSVGNSTLTEYTVKEDSKHLVVS